MREFTEQGKKNKEKIGKIKEKISKNVMTNLENDFQPDSRFEEKDRLGNDFMLFDEDPNSVDLIYNNFEPIDDDELKLKAGSNNHPDESRRIRKEKQVEEGDKKYLKEKYDNKGKPIEGRRFTSKVNSITRKKILQKKPKVKERLILRESGDLAEMISIALGDGCIPKKKHSFKVTLNRSEEKQYTKYVNELMQNVFKQKPHIYNHKDADAVRMEYYRKDIINGLIDKGLKAGDKKENQVDVPQWIKNVKEFQRRSLMGLVDTDGSIHIHKHNKTLHISFNNASIPLVGNFKEMCKTFDVETVKISPVKGKNTYTTGMESKKEVAKFLDLIKPNKWKYRARTFGLVLISINDPKKRKKIEEKLYKTYPDKRVHHSKDYVEKLENLCVTQGLDVNNEAIIKEIEKMLTYSDNYTGYTKEKKLKLNFHAKNVINDLKKKFK